MGSVEGEREREKEVENKQEGSQNRGHKRREWQIEENCTN